MAEKTQINTRLVIRNADLSAWEKSTVKLLPGEMAFAKILDGEYSGSYKIRIGTGDKTWNELSDQGQLVIPAANVEGLNEAIASLSTSYYETTDIETLSGEYVNGDIAVEKKDIAGGKQEFCAYRYDRTAGAWKALDGNYSAENVYFKENFTLAGDYTQVGNVKLASGTLEAAGKSVKTLFEDIFDKTIQPTMGSAPTNSVTLTQSGCYEVGTKKTPSYSVTFNQGKYNNPWNGTTSNDGTSDTSWSVSNGTTTLTTKTGTFDEITVVDGTNYKLTSSTGYSDGTVAKDNKGNNSSPEIKRTAGTTASANSSAITGFRYVYIGSIASDDEVTETVIKNLSNKYKTSDIGSSGITKTLKASGGDIPLVSGAVKVIVACPTGSYAKNLNQVLLVSASNTPITSDYKENANVKVSGVTSGENKIDYKVWVYQPASIDAGEVHAITIK